MAREEIKKLIEKAVKKLYKKTCLQAARIGLILATRIVLKNALNLMGISAPEKM